ncbi:MAG: chorismate mutase [Peptococcaceae bacterium]|nr:chorismate mutase [Peptococcaceae bacterium]
MDNGHLIELRSQIDALDCQLRRVFYRRMEICERIGALKALDEIPVVDEARESEVLAAVEGERPEYLEEALALMRLVMELSRSRQSKGRALS